MPDAVKKTDKWRDIGDVGTVGIEFVLSIALGWWVGHWLDHRYFGDRGIATFIGASFGVAAAFKAIWEAAKRARRRLEELEREEHEHDTRR
jgi:hypothetical protein